MKVREQLETDFPVTLEALLHERLTEHEAKQFEQDFIAVSAARPKNMSVSAEPSVCWKRVILIVRTN